MLLVILSSYSSYNWQTKPEGFFPRLLFHQEDRFSSSPSDINFLKSSSETFLIKSETKKKSLQSRHLEKMIRFLTLLCFHDLFKQVKLSSNEKLSSY